MQVYNDPTDLPEKPPIFRKGFPPVILVLTGAIVAVSLIQINVRPTSPRLLLPMISLHLRILIQENPCCITFHIFILT